MSRRAMSRSIAVRECTGVVESGGVERFTQAGTAGAVWPCSRHHASHDATAARRAFQVLTAEEPHRVSRVSPISSSATSASRRVSPSVAVVLSTAMP